MKTVKFLSLEKQQTQLRDGLMSAFQEALESSHYVLGEQVTAFEREFAAYTGTKYCLGAGNGFDALTMSLKACQLTPADEVIVPAHTYVATWLAISQTHARIVPVDADPLTMNINVYSIESHITPQTRLILPVHLYGQPCNMTVIAEIAGRHDLDIVEDNAQAHGALWKNRKTGSWGVANATSFYPTKNLGALGDGGAVTTSDDDMAAYIRAYRNYGFEEKNNAVTHGANSRLDELQAAFLRLKLARLDEWNSERRFLASAYMERLKGLEHLQLPHTDADAYHVYHLFVVRSKYRDELRKFLQSKGIETMIHYPIPPHLQLVYKDLNFRKGRFPVAEKLAETMISLPLWPGLPLADIDYVCDQINDFFR